jgi:hypothetical protein
MRRLALLGVLFFAAVLPLRAQEAPKPSEAPAADEVVSCGEFPNLAGYTDAERAELNRQASLHEARYCAARKDILGWGRALFPDKFSIDFCPDLHQYLVDIRHEPFASTEAPRGHAKTTIKCFLIPIFQALEEPETFNHYLNVQSNDEKSLAINTTIKTEFDENQLLRAMYGDVRSPRWTNGQFVVRIADKTGKVHDVCFSARSAGQSLRGINYNSRRPDYILTDDLYQEDDYFSKESTEKKNAWFDGTLMLCRAKAKKSCVHLLGTAANVYDKFEVNKKNAKASPLTDVKDAKPEGRWICRTFKAVKDEVNKIVLWPALNSFDELMADKADSGTGSLVFNREMQNERWDEVSAIIKRDWLKGWLYDPAIKWANLPVNYGAQSKVRIIGTRFGCDPSTGEKETGDPAGFAIIVETRGPGTRVDYWIEAMANEVLSFDPRLDKLVTMAAQHEARYPDPQFKIRRAFVEAISGFTDFADQAKKKTNLPVTPIHWVKGKRANLAAKSGAFEHGQVHVSKDIDPKLITILVDQLVTNEPDHDDLRDAVLLCLEEPNKDMRTWVNG